MTYKMNLLRFKKDTWKIARRLKCDKETVLRWGERHHKGEDITDKAPGLILKNKVGWRQILRRKETQKLKKILCESNNKGSILPAYFISEERDYIYLNYVIGNICPIDFNDDCRQGAELSNCDGGKKICDNYKNDIESTATFNIIS